MCATLESPYLSDLAAKAENLEPLTLTWLDDGSFDVDVFCALFDRHPRLRRIVWRDFDVADWLESLTMGQTLTTAELLRVHEVLRDHTCAVAHS